MSSNSTKNTVSRVRTEGAELHVETRGSGPPVVLFGCPMDADAFGPLADLLAQDHTVITSDPRGIKRSSVVDPDADVSPEVLADDLSAILQHLDVKTASVFGSSGGAVAALGFAQRHPGQLDTVIAHEPPLEELLDDHDHLRANTEKMVDRYLGGDVRGAWEMFFTSANIPMPREATAAWIDERTDAQEIADERFFFAHTLRPATYWRPDTALLRRLPRTVVVGVGSESAGQICDRTTAALAAALGIARTTFVGGHTGFIDHPDRFAEQLRSVLSAETTAIDSPAEDS